jgi:hypothetical protein
MKAARAKRPARLAPETATRELAPEVVMDDGVGVLVAYLEVVPTGV